MSKIQEKSEWLNGTDTAKLLGITTMTLWRWERDPELSFPVPVMVRERKYWLRESINQWMRARGKAEEAA